MEKIIKNKKRNYEIALTQSEVSDLICLLQSDSYNWELLIDLLEIQHHTHIGQERKSLTDILFFCDGYEMSPKLKLTLKKNYIYLGRYIECVDVRQMRKIRNVGEKTINELIQIRGY